MYESQAFHGYGSQLLVGDGASPETFYPIAEVTTITPGAMTTAAITTTHLESPEAHAEKIPGMRDTGAIGLVGNWLPTDPSQSNDDGTSSPPAGAGGLVFLARTRAVRNFKIKLSNPQQTEWPIRGFISSFQPGAIGVDDKVSFTAEITPSKDTAAALP